MSETKQISVTLNCDEEKLLREAGQVTSLNLTSFIRNSAVMRARNILKFAVSKEQINPLFFETKKQLEEAH